MNTIYTIGHSTRIIEQFIALLNAHDIQMVVDVRTIPKSRHNPQFGQDMLAPELTPFLKVEDEKITYPAS